MSIRSRGILLHPTSLPGPYGIGDFGPEAYRFVDRLAADGWNLWQVLPMGPTGFGDSPYGALSAFAGNPLLISPDLLVKDGRLTRAEARPTRPFPTRRVNYRRVAAYKTRFLHAAFARHPRPATSDPLSAPWLSDFAFFMALKDHFGGKPWFRWPKAIRFREAAAVERYRARVRDGIAYHRFVQSVFHDQWMRLKRYANAKGVRLVGDMPFFVSYDSADVWTQPRLFLLDRRRRPTVVSGVPPDYFSRTGQRWGNPLYNWAVHKRTGFAWWTARVRANLAVYDMLRIDHFRGLTACWAVPRRNRTARRGRWMRAPGRELLAAWQRELKRLPFIAEDLGYMTPAARRLPAEFGIPGMKILQFGLEACEPNDYLPDAWPKRCAAYTGTHDNDTMRGWYEQARPEARRFARRTLRCRAAEVAPAAIRALIESRARLVIIPMQDMLNLGRAARMNVPVTTQGNWQWRMPSLALRRRLRPAVSPPRPAADRGSGRGSDRAGRPRGRKGRGRGRS